MSLIFFILIAFPYITPFSTSFDTQPWALIFSVIYFVYSLFSSQKEKMNKLLVFNMLMLLFTTLSFLIFAVLGLNNILDGLKSLLAYWSLFFIPYTTVKLTKNLHGKQLKYFVFIWLIVGLVQYLINPTFGISLLHRISRSQNRGITSLAPEPAWLGRWGIFVIVINDYFRIANKTTKKDYKVILFCSIILIILSASGMGMALLALYIVIRTVAELYISKNFKNALIFLFFGCVLYLSFSYIPIFAESRAGTLLYEFKTDASSLRKYGGVSLRLGNPIRAIYGGMIETKGFGFGLGSTVFDDKLLPSWLINILSVQGIESTWGGRVRGGLVSMVYEVGFVGLLYLFHLFYIFIKPIRISTSKIPSTHKICFSTSLFVVFGSVFIEGALSNPLLGFIIGLNIFYLSEYGRIRNNTVPVKPL